MDVTFFASSDEFRQWLEQNHDTMQELWIGFYKKDSGKTGITYKEAVDQALCFGWIDGIRKSVDTLSYMNRFTPRKRSSNWSSVNIKRVGELTEMGLMHPAGIKAFTERDPRRSEMYSFERENVALDSAYEEKLRANEKAWSFFQAQPPSYRKPAIWWVMSARQEATRLKRLATLIEDSENGLRIALLRR
jgi:uncharacterized protein YdeI (YjbR/CyaY-like superfamily)